MALLRSSIFPIPSFTKTQCINSCLSVKLSSSSSNGFFPLRRPAVRCSADNQKILRRSANYQPSIWSYDFFQSLKSDFEGYSCRERIKELKEEVRGILLDKVEETILLDKIEVIATLKRLGIAYHFEEEIERILERVYNDNYNYKGNNKSRAKDDLNTIALEFRLLREHGYEISPDVFKTFKNEEGNFKKHLCEDIEAIVSLYEASFLLEEGESLLEDARNFTTETLKNYVKAENINEERNNYERVLARHALELPLHWRMLRLEARWFIDVYETKEGMNPLLLQLAKLDFNVVQAVHQEDLKNTSMWWRNTGIGKELRFARDRLMENFLWTVGVKFEPEFGHCRRILTKVNCLITTIDDVYDVFGTLDELELFTNALERWEMRGMEQLPECMKICFLALDSLVNEMASKEQGFHIVPYLKKAWTDLCKAYLMEAKWYYSGYTPSLEEYMENAWVSISGPAILVHFYLAASTPITEEAIQCLMQYPPLIQWSSMILRLADDLGTSSDELKRGDVPKSIQCYMHETGASELEARKHIKDLINKTWKKMNKEVRVTRVVFPETFVDAAMNLARMAQCVYQNGDGHASQDREAKERQICLLVNPIQSATPNH